MTREEIIKELKRFFDIQELVCDHTYEKYKENAWRFLQTDFLHALLIIRRDIIKAPMWCNSRTAHQRGLRCNRCQLVREKNNVYLSAHVLGCAGDFTIPSLKTAQDAREEIKANQSHLPCKIRLERWDSSGREISWVHIDTIDGGPQQPKVYEFKA